MKNVTLYIGTCVDSGLNYFGKSTAHLTQKDLQKNYWGSGPKWIEHYSEFGNKVNMKVYWTGLESEVEEVALKFSRDNRIVASNQWLNQIEEDGLNGGWDAVNSSGKNLYYDANGNCLNTVNYVKAGQDKQKWLRENDENWVNNTNLSISLGQQKFYKDGGKGSFTGKKHTEETKDLMRGHTFQNGEKNSQFGTIWIHNDFVEASTKVKPQYFETWQIKGWKIGKLLDKTKIDRVVKEQKSKAIKKILKGVRNKRKLEAEKNFYIDLFEKYKTENFKSMREFVRNGCYDKSHVTLTKKFKKHIENYESVVKPFTTKRMGM